MKWVYPPEIAMSAEMLALDPLPVSPTPGAVPPLRLQTFTYDDRRETLAAVGRALDRCGAWVLDRQAISVELTRLRLEMELRSALELYSGLIAAGLELTRGSHLALTELCTLARHRRRGREPFRVVELVLELSFLDEMEHRPMPLPGAAA